VSVVFCQVEISAMGRSFVQSSPTDCGVSECDQLKQQPSTPTVGGQSSDKERKNYRKERRKKNALLLKMKEAHSLENLGTRRHSLSVRNTVNYY